MQYIDLSHTFIDNMPVFPGDPPASLRQITSVEKNGYTDHALSTVMHVGTHIDAPLHMIAGGAYLDDIAISHFTGPGIFINAYKKQVIDEDILNGISIAQGAIVILYTGMSEIYGTPPYDSAYPVITEAFAVRIAASGVNILGLDFINPDHDESFPVHKILLSKNVLIIENLTNLKALIEVSSFEVFAFPMKLHAEAAPVRVVARFG